MPVRRFTTVLKMPMLKGGVIAVLIILSYFGGRALAREGGVPRPIPAPGSLLRAREACPDTASLVQCRGELRRAYAAVAWQQSENLKLARQMLGNVTDWKCIHGGEGAWTDATGNGYYGGLQMDRGFMRTYGPDMLREHAGQGAGGEGLADSWTPREQIIVAQRAFIQGRGYAPWPQTSRACGLR